MRTRFAPSPTGYLHLGHAKAAYEAFHYAQSAGGVCLLRIEDTDHTRCKPEYTQAVFTDLNWLGFDWPVPVRRQSQHYPDYAKVVLQLLERGLAYPCALTRSDIKNGSQPAPENFAAHWNNEQVISRLQSAAATEAPTLPFSIRLNLSKAIRTLNKAAKFKETGPLYTGVYDARESLAQREDPILARKDIGCSYMIAGPHDDWHQNISHVVRGADLFHATALHVLIQNLMGWPTPLYHHHGLVLAETGEKLSKRNLDTSLHGLREAGQTRENIFDLIHMDRL